MKVGISIDLVELVKGSWAGARLDLVWLGWSLFNFLGARSRGKPTGIQQPSSSSSFFSAVSSPSSTATSWFSGIVRARTKIHSVKMTNNSSEYNAGPIKAKNQFFAVCFSSTDPNLFQPLAIALDKEKWSLVQLLMSSSYTGYGTSSLKQDASELDQLVSYLINKEDSEGVVLLGHSTGCQDIVHYMRTNAACSRAVRAAILQLDMDFYNLCDDILFLATASFVHPLAAFAYNSNWNVQAPVSDREYRATLPETASMIDLASTMIAEELYYILSLNKAFCRYHSLCAYMGDDDLFSSDLSDDQLRMRLGHMSNTPCQVIFSMADEYVPEYVDKKALVERLCRVMGGAEKVEIEHGNHSLSNRVQEAVQAIVDFVKRDGPKGWDDPWN
uniref:Uncharacterized protein n=1 Tax=Salix viminalis TaxID=40686 RepID=A0A6N2KP57_SALVM